MIEDGIYKALVSAEKRLGIVLDDEKRGLLLLHMQLVIEKNEQINLTRIETEEDGVILHIEDSLSCLEEINGIESGSFCDIGTGAGYPGIPLNIVTGRKGTLIDSVQKKARCVEEFIGQLGLDGIDVYGIRAEELAMKERSKYKIVVARALTALPSLVELASPLLMKGGRLIALKGNPELAEIEAGRKVAAEVGMKELSVRKLTIGEDGIPRTIMAYEKIGGSKLKLPRHVGMAQRHPLH